MIDGVAQASQCALRVANKHNRISRAVPLSTQTALDVFVQMLFYATPVIYVLETLDISDAIKEGMALNPLAAILIQMRHAMFDPRAPTAAEAVGGPLMLLIPIGFTIGIVVLGFRVFSREAPRIAEEL